MSVLLIKDWEKLKDYIETHPKDQVAYKIDYIGSDKVRLRITVGIYAMDQMFKEDDTVMDGILRFLESKDPWIIEKEIPIEIFYM